MAGAAFVVATGAVIALGAITIAGVDESRAPRAESPRHRGRAGSAPIVLAGVTHPETGAVAWVPIAAWDEIRAERDW